MVNKEKLIRYGEDYLRDLIGACCKIEDLHKEFVWESVKALKQVSKTGAIPDNATNGDVFKAVFSAKEIGVDVWSHSMGASMNDDYDRYFNLDWWNAPYEGNKGR